MLSSTLVLRRARKNGRLTQKVEVVKVVAEAGWCDKCTITGSEKKGVDGGVVDRGKWGDPNGCEGLGC